MPETITGDGTNYDNSLSVPVNNDLASASSVKTPFQRLLSNVKHVYDRVFSTGVLAIRHVSDLASMKTLTGMATGQVCLVRNYGLYFYVDPDGNTESTPYLIKPNVGTGTWIHANRFLPVAPTDNFAKVPVENLHNVIVGVYQQTNISDFIVPPVPDAYTEGSTYLNIGDIREGDVIDAQAMIQLNISTTTEYTDNVRAAVRVSSYGVINSASGSLCVDIVSSKFHTIAVSPRVKYVCSNLDENDGYVRVRGIGTRTTGVSGFGISVLSLSALHIRP